MPSATSASNSPAEKRESTLLRNVFFVFFVSGACSQPLGSLMPFLRLEYGFDYDTAGMLISMQSVGNLVAVLLAGILPLYLGRRKSVLLTAVWMTVAYIVFAGALHPFFLLMFATTMMGFARGGTSIFTNTMVSTLPDAKATYGYNRLHGSYAVGALLSPLVLLGCVALWPKMGWRVLSTALLLLAISQVVVYLKMDLPEEPKKVKGKVADLRFLRTKEFWLGGLILFFYISTEYAIIGWLVTYFQDIGVLSDNLSQLMNSLFWLMMFVGRTFGGRYGHKIARTKLLLIDGFGLVAFFLLMFFSRSAVPVIIGLIGVGLFMATIYPTAFALGSVRIKGNDTGCSFMSFIGSIGGIITPALVGFVAKAAGIQAGMACVLGAATLLLATILLSHFTTRKAA